MISEIEIENFRSIRSDSITLEPLTVLIGANGSGKSNLVKALEFISDIPRASVHVAVSRQGGREGMAPKSIPIGEIKNSPTRFKYRSALIPPSTTDNKEGPKSVDVEHEFKISFKSNRSIKIISESLTFHKVLFIGSVLDSKKTKEAQRGSPGDHTTDSFFYIGHNGGITNYKMEPPVTNETMKYYLTWLGLETLKDKITTPDELTDFLKSFRKGRSRRLSGKGTTLLNKVDGLFIDSSTPTIIDFAPQFQIFLSTSESIKRYDLLLNELRREQAPSDSPELSKTGENMPAALRKMTSDKESYTRLKASFEAIAPHITNMKSSSLRTGKEFVEFFESNSGRGIESWESSDGSLRALAILVALETADVGDTVIIEEPEQNLHPWAIRTLIDHMREIVEEKAVQIILTTHSEHVLERVEPKEVRVVTRLPDEGTKFKRIDQIILKKKIVMGEVGRLWVKGMLGGVPSV